jgi:hypothetical protein
MQQIESGNYNNPALAQGLYYPPSPISENAEKVIDQYTLATGRDLKSQTVSVVPHPKSMSLPAGKRPTPHPQLMAGRPNGHAAPKQ